MSDETWAMRAFVTITTLALMAAFAVIFGCAPVRRTHILIEPWRVVVNSETSRLPWVIGEADTTTTGTVTTKRTIWELGALAIMAVAP